MYKHSNMFPNSLCFILCSKISYVSRGGRSDQGQMEEAAPDAQMTYSRGLLLWRLDVSTNRRKVLLVPALYVCVCMSVCRCCHHSLQANTQREGMLTPFLSALHFSSVSPSWHSGLLALLYVWADLRRGWLGCFSESLIFPQMLLLNRILYYYLSSLARTDLQL